MISSLPRGDELLSGLHSSIVSTATLAGNWLSHFHYPDAFAQWYGETTATRLFGTIQVVGGAMQVLSGMAACGTVIGCVVGGPLILRGLDDVQASARSAISGEEVQTFTYQVAKYFSGGNESVALLVDFATGIASPGAALKVLTSGARAVRAVNVLSKLEHATQLAHTTRATDVIANSLRLGRHGESLADLGKVADNAAIRTLIDDASRFAQRDYSEVFSGKGIKAYSELAGKRIVTIDDLVGALRSGAIKPSQLPLDVIRRGDASIILNTRTSEALRRAGIDRSLWNGVDRTGNELFESLLNDQLRRNMLGNGGVLGPISQGFGL
jgi:hypothetical protein